MKHTPPIIALDFASAQESLAFLDRFQGEKLFVKVGMELFIKKALPSLKNST